MSSRVSPRAAWLMLTMLALVGGFVASPACADAQLLTARGLFVAGPQETAGRDRVMPRSEVFTAIDFSTRRAKGFQSSDYRLGLLVDVVRLGSSSSLAVLLGSEMKVTPDNSFGFHPRGIIWEEQVALFTRRHGIDWTLAGFARCRHDVDNGTPMEALDSVPLIPASGRVVVLQGAQIGAAFPEWGIAPRVRVRVGGQAEAYVSPEDRRTPNTKSAPDWRAARASGLITARLRFVVNDRVSAYGRTWQSHVVFDEADRGATLHTNLSGEMGLRVAGPSSGVDVFFAREQTFDDGTGVSPRRVASTTIGLRLSGKSLF